MRSQLKNILAVLALLAAGSGSRAWAQTIGGNINQPPVSPYINILRGGAPAAVNYYNLVQPQLQFYSAINQLQNQQQTSYAALSTLGYETTGHAAQFVNYTHYYPTLGLGTQGGPRGLQNLQNRLQQNSPTRNLGTAPVNPFTQRRTSVTGQ